MIEIKDKKILLLGLGLHGGGVASAKWLVKHGADLRISDLKTNRQLAPSLAKLRADIRRWRNIHFILGRHREQDVKWADIIVYSPGVPRESPYLELGRKLGKLIVNEAALFFDRCPAMIIGVSGTRGKSTTVSLIGAMLKAAGRKVIVAGNIRDTAMLDVADKIKPNDIAVLELSSWQLEGLSIIKKSPHIAVITNLYPDHLNRYKKLSDYYNSKKEIWRYQNKDDFLVLNGRDKVLDSWAEQTKSQVVFFDKIDSRLFKGFLHSSRPSRRAGLGRNDNKKFRIAWGAHNLENAAAALAVARLLEVKVGAIKKVLAKPPRLCGRQEIIAKKGGVTFINDTCATSPEAGMAALRRFGQPDKKNILLIAGGADKGLDYRDWAREARAVCREIYLLAGAAGEKMARSLNGFKRAPGGYNNLRDALKEARAVSRPGDIILFSPAAASFNLWQHEFERGADFIKQVKSLKN